MMPLHPAGHGPARAPALPAAPAGLVHAAAGRGARAAGARDRARASACAPARSARSSSSRRWPRSCRARCSARCSACRRRTARACAAGPRSSPGSQDAELNPGGGPPAASIEMAMYGIAGAAAPREERRATSRPIAVNGEVDGATHDRRRVRRLLRAARDRGQRHDPQPALVRPAASCSSTPRRSADLRRRSALISVRRRGDAPLREPAPLLPRAPPPATPFCVARRSAPARRRRPALPAPRTAIPEVRRPRALRHPAQPEPAPVVRLRRALLPGRGARPPSRRACSSRSCSPAFPALRAPGAAEPRHQRSESGNNALKSPAGAALLSLDAPAGPGAKSR